MPKVEFSAANINSCFCPNCPVQAGSECFQQRVRNRQPIPPDASELPDPKLMVGLYCSIGRSTCQDLDGQQNCICPNCPVWERYNLTSRYYCLQGNADEVDVQ